MSSVRLTGVMVLVSPIKTHKWTRVRLPTHAIVNSPTHLTLAVAPKPSPVVANQNHQLASKAFEGPCSCWFVKHVQARAVNAVKTINGESRRMSLD